MTVELSGLIEDVSVRDEELVVTVEFSGLIEDVSVRDGELVVGLVDKLKRFL